MQILLTDARAGMILSEDVLVSGGVLLGHNEVLDDTLIALLENCGVTSVSVVDPASGNHEKGEHNANETVATGDVAGIQQKPAQKASANNVTYADPSHGTVPPEIHISIDNNGMAAHLAIEPVIGSTSVITGEVIHRALAGYGIVHGINTILIEEAAAKWREKRQLYVFRDIAAGEPPHPAIEGPVNMLVGHLSKDAECEKVRHMTSFQDVLIEIPGITRVSKGSIIAQRTITHQATAGIDIFGNAVVSRQMIDTEIIAGENAVVNNDNGTVVAQCDGVAYRINATIGVVSVNVDGAFTLEITSDHMLVKCSIVPPGPGGRLPSKQALLDMLSKASVVFGIDENDIDEMFVRCSQGNYPTEPVVIARGLAPVNGLDGKCIYHFKTDSSLAPAINNDGSADYKTVNIVTTAERNQKLAEIVPPGDGKDGSDVSGKLLSSHPGNPVKLPRGPHTMPDPENPDILVAEVDGIVRLSGGNVEVCEGFIVKGDVDFSTGNIDYPKTVIVNGDVKSGFGVHTGADLQVNGTIEDCHITTGGSVLCRYGFVGQGRGCIEAKGDVNLSFIKNQCVKSFKTINIAKEALNSTLQSRAAIIVHGRPVSVAGGELKAKNMITVYTVGNQTGIRTLLEVGVDFLMVDELAMIERQIVETAANFKVVADAFTRYQKGMTAKKGLSTAERGKLDELTGAFRQARQKLSVLEERKTIIHEKIYTMGDCRIVIEHAAYPGTLLKFGDRHHAIREELIGPKTIIYTGNEIKIY